MSIEFQEYIDKTSLFLENNGVVIDPFDMDFESEIKQLVTKIQEQERELRYSKERIYKAFYYSHIPQMVTGTFGDIKAANQALADLLGYEIEELLEFSTQDLVPKELKEKEIDFHADVKDKLLEVSRKNIPVWEKKYTHKTGNILTVYVSVYPVQKDWHNICYYIGRLPKILHIDE